MAVVEANDPRRLRTGRSPYRRRWPAALLVGAVVATSCSRDVSESPLAIVPPTSAVTSGGVHQYAVTGDPPVLWGVTQSGSSAPTDSPVYPLKVSANGRYLVDQNDRPWRVQADAAWVMSSVATPEEVDQYLDTRSAQGYNSFYLMAMVHPLGYGTAPNAPNDANGDPPFAVPGDFSTAAASPASARYWDWIDWIIDRAAARNMVVMLAYTYLGGHGGEQGWFSDVMAQPSVQSLHDWGVWLGRRFKDKPNILWFGLGDYAPPARSEGAKRARAIADGIKSTGASQLFMAEANAPDEIPGENPDFGPVLDMNSFYGYGPVGNTAVYLTADRAWSFSPARPAWMQEGTYEYENNWHEFSARPWDTRRGRFWSVLAGGTAGDGFGSRDPYQWVDIPASLSSPGARYSTYAFDFFRSMPWWELAPSGTDPGKAGVDLIPSGAGTWGDVDYITSALTNSHDWLLAYVPVTGVGRRSFDVDMAALADRARARWFDPATGNYIAISDGYSLDNHGTMQFTTPDVRADGTDDWLLVLDTAHSDSCGSITPTGLYTAPPSIPAGITCDVTATLVDDPDVVVSSRVDVADG